MATIKQPPPSRRLAFFLAGAFLSAINALALPRQPMPPLPEMMQVLWRENFDGPFMTTNRTETVSTSYGLLVSSWSGYALERAGKVSPMIVPALNGAGKTNVACESGAIRFWLTPYWGSTTTGGSGPGGNARLLELVAVGEKEVLTNWSLQVAPNGNAISLYSQSETGAVQLLSAAIAWTANTPHCLALNYSPTGSLLYIDGQVAATGGGTYALPPSIVGLVVGSAFDGSDPAGGYVDKVYAFGQPLSQSAVTFHYNANADEAALGPVTEEEVAAQQAMFEEWAKQKAQQEEIGGGGMQMMMMLIGPIDCITNIPVLITNISCTNIVGQGWTTEFDVQGSWDGSTTALYDIFSTTNLVGSHITNSVWTWLERGPSCARYQYTNQLDALTFYILGTPKDSDGDGLTDAYENLVSKTNPNLWDTDGDGISDRDEVILRTNPLVDQSAQSSGRLNYQYDPGGWLLSVSGIIGDGFGYDAEGNVTP